MHSERSATNILLQALTSNEKDFAKILLDEKTATHCPKYQNPLEEAFVQHFASATDKESLRALALIAALYLSVMHCDFPTPLLRTSIGYLRENITLPAFNCSHYEKLYEKLSLEESIELSLFTNIDKFAKINLTKNQVFDAFDFLSNGL
jgi:hypothetical protein